MAETEHELIRRIEYQVSNIDTNVAALSGGTVARSIAGPTLQAVSTSAVALLAANPNRCYFRIANNGPAPVRLAFNATADLTGTGNTDPEMVAGGVYEDASGQLSIGSVSAITATGTANLVIHEVTKA